jgi:hypothetical protein
VEAILAEGTGTGNHKYLDQIKGKDHIILIA